MSALSWSRLTRRFGGVVAVDAGRDSRSMRGEVCRRCRPQRRGQVTLIELLSGALARDAGACASPARRALRSPRDGASSRASHLCTSHLALADNLDAVANVFLGHELRARRGLLDERAMEREARALLERLVAGLHRAARAGRAAVGRPAPARRDRARAAARRKAAADGRADRGARTRRARARRGARRAARADSSRSCS
jgi:ABC-type sugar transport system ATPase subunit